MAKNFGNRAQWSPEGAKKAEAERGLKLPDPSPHKDAFLKGRLADRIDDGTGQRDALKKLINNPCENAFELSNWNTRYSLNRNSYSMDQLFDLVATGFTSGCGQNADVISAGLVQGLNYDYTAFDNGGSNLSLTASGGNTAISGASCTLDCDGSYPVLAIFGCVAAAGTSDIVEWNIGINGDVGDNTDDTYRWRIGYLSGQQGVLGTSYACMIDASEIPRGSNTFQVGYATAAVNAGTLYFSGVNTAYFMVIELKTVEGQITQAKVDNRTVTSMTRISDWADRPTNPVDGEVIILEFDSDTFWTLAYDEANDRWNFVGGPPAWDEVAALQGTTSSTFTDLATAGPKITLPAYGRYHATYGAGLVYTVTAGAGGMVTLVQGTGTSTISSVNLQNYNSINQREVVFGSGDFTLSSGSLEARVRYRRWTGTGTPQWQERQLSITPYYLEN